LIKGLEEDLQLREERGPLRNHNLKKSRKMWCNWKAKGVPSRNKYTQQEVPSNGELGKDSVYRQSEDLHKDLLQEDELLSVFRSLEQADRDAVLDMARRLRRR
jgi:hypothetical protein